MKLYFKSTTLDKEIGWTWKDMDKAYWDTWIPKKSDIKIVTRLNKEQRKKHLMSYGKTCKGLYNLHVIETTQDVEQKDLHK